MKQIIGVLSSPFEEKNQIRHISLILNDIVCKTISTTVFHRLWKRLWNFPCTIGGCKKRSRVTGSFGILVDNSVEIVENFALKRLWKTSFDGI